LGPCTSGAWGSAKKKGRPIYGSGHRRKKKTRVSYEDTEKVQRLLNRIASREVSTGDNEKKNLTKAGSSQRWESSKANERIRKIGTQQRGQTKMSFIGSEKFGRGGAGDFSPIRLPKWKLTD